MNPGEKIQELRKEKGLTQAELAKKAGLSEISIRKYEKGDRKPKIETLRCIAGALEIPLSEFSDNFMELPEFRTDVYGTTIKDMIQFIKKGPCHISKEESNKLLIELNACIKKGERIENLDELSNFYWDSELNFSHKFLHAILDQYSNQNVYDLVVLLNYFLALTDIAQNKILEYILDLYEISVYRKK
ncbi:hypothetical protein LAD12857_49490 [Lacrimispora amygdalina]|uniref:HTH cro/C1-type domain-containing protein n=1 Tax=Lacrimispora amygdalina TaxID=253257 RepID=A0ABQ5MDY0_9FIRM